MEFCLPIRVYYEDTDSGGVVYHSKYLNYCERARTEALRTLGFEQDELIEQDDTIFAVRSIQIEYIKPARFNDEIVVTSYITETKKASMSFNQHITRKDDDRLLCNLTARVACLSASLLKPRAIPAAIRQQLEEMRAG